MVGFSGYILTSRPGALNFESLSNPSLSSLTSLLESSPSQAIQSRKPPFISYTSGDVLINAGAQSYKAEPFQTLRVNDEIFTLTNGKIILNLGKEQFVLIEPGSKVTIKGLPKRNRGFTDLIVTKGKVLVDFFEGKHPVGIRMELPNAFVLSPDASFRVKVKDGDSRIAVDRKTIMVKKKNSNEEVAASPGSGVLVDSIPMQVGRFPWVDGFNWDQAYNQMAIEGVGASSKMKAPLLRERTPEVSRAAMRNVSRKRDRSTANIQTRPSNEASKVVSKKSVGLGKGALNALSKIPVLGKNITESTETIGNFEDIQKDRTKALDTMEEE